MKNMKEVLKWFFGILFLIGGIGGLIETPMFGIIAIIIGFFILPPTFKIIEQKLKFNFSSPLKWGIVIGGVILMSIIVSSGNSKKDKEADIIVEKASDLIDKGEIDSALVLIEEAKGKYNTTNINKAVDLEAEIEKSKSVGYAKDELAAMSDEEFGQLKKDKLNKSYLSQKTLNNNFIALLKTQAPDRKKIIEEIKAKVEQERIANELAEEQKKQEELIKNRNELIEKQFSGWDGSHRKLTDLIKKSMNDPDSYEHIETRFRDNGDYLFVTTKFRGKNAFGGKVLNSVSAKVDFEGNVLEIVSQN